MPRFRPGTRWFLLSLIALPVVISCSVVGGDDVSVQLVREFRVNSFPPSSIEHLVALGDELLFVATSEDQSKAIWKTDGTDSGTVKVFDSPGRNTPAALTASNGLVYFIADAGNGDDIALWRTDGTERGTIRLLNTQPWRTSGRAHITLMKPFRTGLAFSISRPVGGAGIFFSDGSPEGTFQVTGTRIGDQWEIIGDHLYFSSQVGTIDGWRLWKSDGTVDGTVQVSNLHVDIRTDYTAVDGTLFFRADDGEHGEELWKSDGTDAGTVMVKDIYPGEAASRPFLMENVDGTLFFTADDGQHDHELWKSDGTEAGTVMVKDIRVGSDPAQIREIKAWNGKAFFTPREFEHGYEAWISDGTESGTKLLKDIWKGDDGGEPHLFAESGDRLFFVANEGNSKRDLWYTDGTSGGTKKAGDLGERASSSDVPRYLTDVDGTLYFVVSFGLWKAE